MEAALDLLVRDCRGEERGSVRQMAVRWVWTKDAVYRFLRDSKCDSLCNGNGHGNKEVTDAAATASATARATAKAEMEWRVEQVYLAHCRTRMAWLEKVNEADGASPPPALTEQLRRYIRKSLKEHDGHLLGVDQRDEWKRDSAVRKSGMGIFCDEFMVGEHAKNDRHNGGKVLAFEPERAWKIKDGSDPVPRFVAAYDKRKRQER